MSEKARKAKKKTRRKIPFVERGREGHIFIPRSFAHFCLFIVCATGENKEDFVVCLVILFGLLFCFFLFLFLWCDVHALERGRDSVINPCKTPNKKKNK